MDGRLPFRPSQFTQGILVGESQRALGQQHQDLAAGHAVFEQGDQAGGPGRRLPAAGRTLQEKALAIGGVQESGLGVGQDGDGHSSYFTG